MYLYEDRMRAVKLYILLGERTAATIRQSGYLIKNSLKSWYQDYQRSLDLPMGYVRLKPRYSPSQKTRVVEHYLDHGHCMAATIRALGYPCRDLLAAWIQELHPEFRKRLTGKTQEVPCSAVLKQAAVIPLCTRQKSADAVAKNLCVCRPTLYNWKNQLLGHEAPASMKRIKNHHPSQNAQSWSANSKRYGAIFGI